MKIELKPGRKKGRWGVWAGETRLGHVARGNHGWRPIPNLKQAWTALHALELPTSARSKGHAAKVVAECHEAASSGKLAWTGRRWETVGGACVLCENEDTTKVRAWDVVCGKHLRKAAQLQNKESE